MKLYRLLMVLYPALFRRQYQGQMEQAFRDQLRDSKDHRRLWLHTLYDLLRSAPTLHLEENMQTLAAFACALAAALFLAASNSTPTTPESKSRSSFCSPSSSATGSRSVRGSSP